ncbi:MAG: FRG domain-containing protein [Treponema sp.]|nr:FRG domain-containing protein [Treponema sp.]
MAVDLFTEAIKRKGIGENYGNIVISSFDSEGSGTKKDIRIVPKYEEITCLADFFKLLKKIHNDYEKEKTENDNMWGGKFLYRGQGNINFTFTPSILRNKNDLQREHLLCKELHRRFFDVFDNCKYMFEEQVLAQHYGLGSRSMDLLENPLIALWAACESGENDCFKNSFGEVSIWYIDDYWEELKTFDSNTVSTICNTAIMDEFFTLEQLEIAFLKEQPTAHKDFIYIKDVLRRTAIALPKFNNQRIRNQQSVFAVMNLNELRDDNYIFEKKFGVSITEFTDYIMNAEEKNKGKGVEYQYPNVERLRNGFCTLSGANFSELKSSDLYFQKVLPSEVNYIDSFNLYRYLYKGNNATDKEWYPFTIVVPPKYKSDIEKELKYLSITKSYIYPEIDKVAAELRKTYSFVRT